MYQVLDLTKDDAKEIDEFVKLLSRYTQTGVVFLDIVSVEKKENKEYNVSWFGPNDSFLIEYYNIIDKYFKAENDNRTSLLFLENDLFEGVQSRHKFFSSRIDIACPCVIDCTKKLSSKFKFKKPPNYIPRKHEDFHFEKWKKEILSKLCISFATFSKIEFLIRDREFIAAIWVGYNEGTSSLERDFGYKKIVENFLWSYSTKSIAGDLISDVELQATKAAISQVMARNMSHNIGSHVLENVSKELYEISKKIKLGKVEPSIHGKYFEYAAFLQRFIETRMEFIADVSQAEAPIFFSKGIKSDVINRFYGDYKSSDDEILYPYLLLKYISGTKDITYNPLEKFPDTIAQKISIRLNITEFDDFEVDIPGDILGNHAFYIILENLIRNACKHNTIPICKVEYFENGKRKETFQPQLIFSIKVLENEKSNDFFIVEIIDNLGSENKNKREKIKIGVDDFVSIDRFIQKKMESPIIKDGKLRFGDWGMLEIKICAAYLQGRNLADIDVINAQEVVQAFRANDSLTEGEGYNLGYRFYLLKPKLALMVVSSQFIERNTEKIKKWNKIGVDVITSIESADIRKGSKHQFLVFADRQNTLELSNQRKVFLSEKALENCKNIRLELWNAYMEDKNTSDILTVDNQTSSAIDIDNLILFDDHGNYRYSNPNISTYSYYEPYSSQSPTKSFIEKYTLSKLDEKKIIGYEINEAAKTKVLIIDERIQESIAFGKTDDKAARGMKWIDVLNGMNILIPNAENEAHPGLKNINLNVQSFDDTLKKEIDNWIEGNISNSEYIVVHMGVIEKLVGTTHWETIKDKIDKWEANGQTKVVVTSGRGKPSNLPPETYYIPFTAINHYIVVNRSKYYFIKLLKNARRSK